MFEPLHKLFPQHPERVRHALAVFAKVTQGDLQRMNDAFAQGDWVVIREVAHKAKSACLQIGEPTAAASLIALESAAASAMPSRYAQACAELEAVLSRVEGYLAAAHSRP